MVLHFIHCVDIMVSVSFLFGLVLLIHCKQAWINTRISQTLEALKTLGLLQQVTSDFVYVLFL